MELRHPATGMGDHLHYVSILVQSFHYCNLPKTLQNWQFKAKNGHKTP